MRLQPLFAALALACTAAACAHPSATAADPTPADAAPQVLLLGEVHDNAQGHAQRAAMLRERVEAGWRPVLAMEQFDTGQQAALDAAMRSCADADCVVKQAAPGKSSWTWAHYAPVIELALQHKLTVVAANLSRADASKVIKGGFEAALPAEVIARYQLDALPAPLLAAQATEVRDGHCGMLPATMEEPMATAQVARDVVMAETMRPHAANGVVLIAGNGHVRKDVGVPVWLRKAGLSPRAEGFVEGKADADAFDVVHAIPAVTGRGDPCAAFKAPKPAG